MKVKLILIETLTLEKRKIPAAIIAFKLLLLPYFAIFLYLLDVITEFMAFIAYMLHGHYKWGLGTLGLIILSNLVSCAVALNGLNIFSHKKSNIILHATKMNRYIAYICICTFSAVLFQFELWFTNIQIWKLEVSKKKTSELIRKQEEISVLLTNVMLSNRL